MEDVPPEAWLRLKTAQDSLRELFRLFNYQPLETPLLEPAELFVRKSGGELAAQIYTFTEPGGTLVSLRPEFTSSVMRYVLETGEQGSNPVRVHYAGPVFRYSQDGLRRQFIQVGAELLCAGGLRADVEILSLVSQALSHLGLKRYSLVLNDSAVLSGLLHQMGLSERARSYILSNVSQFKQGDKGLAKVRERASQLGLLATPERPGVIASALERMERREAQDLIQALLQHPEETPLGQREPSEVMERMLGKLRGNDKPAQVEKGLELASRLAAISGRPKDAIKKASEAIVSSGFNGSCLAYLEDVMGLLAQRQSAMSVTLDFGLSRGLGYYTGLIFDVTHPSSQYSLGGGGRYDGLARMLGNSKDVPACGFAHVLEQVFGGLCRRGGASYENIR